MKNSPRKLTADEQCADAIERIHDGEGPEHLLVLARRLRHAGETGQAIAFLERGVTVFVDKVSSLGSVDGDPAARARELLERA